MPWDPFIAIGRGSKHRKTAAAGCHRAAHPNPESITSRNCGHRVQDVIGELNLYVRGWLNDYKLSSTYSEVKDLSEWTPWWLAA